MSTDDEMDKLDSAFKWGAFFSLSEDKRTFTIEDDCGYNYTNLNKEELQRLIAAFQGVCDKMKSE